MKLPFISDRRSEDRRKKERRATTRGSSDRRDSDRRVIQRREFVRLVYPVGGSPEIISYPPEAAPKILDSEPLILTTDFRIAELSKKAIRFICEIKCRKCRQPMELNRKISFTVKFHDGEILDMEADVLRYFGDLSVRAGSFVTLLSAEISPNRINKEQAYLLKNYPDSTNEKPVFNRTITLRDTWTKILKRKS